MKHEALLLDIRLIEQYPVDKNTGMGQHLTRLYVSLDVTGCKLVSQDAMQRIAYAAKMALAKESRRPSKTMAKQKSRKAGH